MHTLFCVRPHLYCHINDTLKQSASGLTGAQWTNDRPRPIYIYEPPPKPDHRQKRINPPQKKIKRKHKQITPRDRKPNNLKMCRPEKIFYHVVSKQEEVINISRYRLRSVKQILVHSITTGHPPI